MTTSDWNKMIPQFKNKPAKLKKYLKHNKPKDRKFGTSVRKCERCGRQGAHVGQYGIKLCRQCFRDLAVELGFKKYS
jgi:small subunit ribosomal protein S14